MPSELPATAFLNPESQQRWQHVQDSCARMTSLSLWTLDVDGKVIGNPSAPPPFCLLLRKNVDGRSICNDHCTLACRQAIRLNAPVFFHCHADLHSFAVPLRVSGQPQGVILGGQTLTASPTLDKYRDLARTCGIAEGELMKAVGTLTIGTEKVLRQAADFMAVTAEVIFNGWDAQNRAGRKLSLYANLFRMSSGFTPEMELHEVFALILNSLSILFDLESAAVIMPRENGTLAVRYALGPRSEELMTATLAGLDVFREQAGPGGLLATDDHYFTLRAGFPAFVKQVVLFPFFMGEVFQGYLAILNHRLDDEETRVVSQFSQHTAFSVQNAILRRELRGKVDTIAAMARLNERCASTHDMESLLAVLFDEATNLARAERASLMVLDRATNELLIKMVRGTDHLLLDCTVSLDEGLAGRVLRMGEPLLVKDLEKDQRVGRGNRPRYRTPSFVILPLKAGGRTIGVLNVADKITGQVFNEEDLEKLKSLFSHASVALEKSELWEQSKELKRISITDSLTGLLNRRYFQERAIEEVERSRRYADPLSLVMIDVDDFKVFNDTNGHPAGDTLLREVGRLIKGTTRTVDIVSRYGGEEFAVLSPSTTKEEACRVAERVRQAILEHRLESGQTQPGGRLTISAGVATFPVDAADIEALIDNADKALYNSKRSGKNRVSPYGLETA